MEHREAEIKAIATQAGIHVAGYARVHIGDVYGGASVQEDTSDIFLSRLRYPLMTARYQQISEAYPRTYSWIFDGEQQQPWTCFDLWLRQSEPVRHCFWVAGKPGSGKSTFLKYLCAQIRHSIQFRSWAKDSSIVQAQHFFWTAGTELQSSLEGFYRSIISQILEQCPSLTPRLVSDCGFTGIRDASTRWDVAQLNEALFYTLQVLSHTRLLLIVDGLDECTGAEAQEKLTDVVQTIARFPSVKMVVSSRPMTTFIEAFITVPQLRLEDLTWSDIKLYVQSKLTNSSRWASLMYAEPSKANKIFYRILDRAEGVFLWVVLILQRILRGLRDGSDLDEVEEMLNQASSDLDTYFTSIFQSIEPEYRREASVLLQLALHHEDQFVRLVDLLLVDTLFIKEPCDNFVLQPNFSTKCLDIRNKSAFQNKLIGAERKINSRCKGMLQCGSGSDDRAQLILSLARARSEVAPVSDPSMKSTVQLLHRSLKDFLLLPKSQETLHFYTGGRPIDARKHICNARIVQLLALCEADCWIDLTVGTASHIMAALAVNDGPDSAALASLIAFAVERLGSKFDTIEVYHGWYISHSLKTWYRDESNFLTLAIDFGLISYASMHMTRDAVCGKSGRPLLDYLLKPIFAGTFNANYRSVAEVSLIRQVLCYGANPNEAYGGSSVWARYLRFLTVKSCSMLANDVSLAEAESEIFGLLITAGVSPILPWTWIIRVHADRSLEVSSPSYDLRAKTIAVEGQLFLRVSDFIERYFAGIRGFEVLKHMESLRDLENRLGGNSDGSDKGSNSRQTH